MFISRNSNLLMDHLQMDHQIMIMLLIMAHSYLILRVYRRTLEKELLLIKIYRVLKSIWRIQKNLCWTSKIQNHLILAVKKQNSKVRLLVWEMPQSSWTNITMMRSVHHLTKSIRGKSTICKITTTLIKVCTFSNRESRLLNSTTVIKEDDKLW